MINNPKLINKVILNIKSLTYEQITEVIRKVDMEEDIKILKDYCYAMVTISSATDKDIEISKRIENVIDRLKEDEAVIKEIVDYVERNNYVNTEECGFMETINLKECKKECKSCIEQYFRKKVNNEIK